jgi:hypothetical protein
MADNRFGKIGRYVRARAVPAEGIPFGEKLFISGNHSRARHAELRGELPRRWQFCPRPQAPRQDRRAKLLVDLAEQRRVVGAINLEAEKVRPALSGFHVDHRVMPRGRRKWYA